MRMIYLVSEFCPHQKTNDCIGCSWFRNGKCTYVEIRGEVSGKYY